MVDGAPCARGGAARARAPAAGPGDGRPQRAVRPARAAPGVRRASAWSGPTRRSSARRRWPARCCRCSASAGWARWPTRSGSRSRLAHRALADAETCARVLCALFPRLCAHAPRSPRRWRCSRPSGAPAAGSAPRARRAQAAQLAAAGALPELDFGELPRDPGVYLFRDAAGATLYVGKSISIRSRARAHFAPSTPRADWTAHAAIVDYRTTRSELGALVLENRLIKELAPPGNIRLTAPRRSARLHPLPARHPVPDPRGRAASRRPATRSRSARCAGAGWRSSWSSSSTRCSACATAGAGCRAASTPRPTARWAAACRRAWATWTRTSTAAASTRRCGCSCGRRTRGGRARCSSTSTRRCARPRPSSATSARRGCAAARGGWG